MEAPRPYSMALTILWAKGFRRRVAFCGQIPPSTQPDVLVADGVSLVTVLISLRDSNDQPVLDYVDSIQIDTTLGTELFPIGDLGGGLYEAFIIASTEAGTATVTVRPDGASFDLQTQVKFTPGEVDLSRCTIEASPSEIPTGGSNSTITVRVADTFDNPIAGQDVAIVNIPVDLNVSNITDNGDGTYTAALTSGTAAQTVQLGFTVNNSAVADARTTVTFTAAEASMGLSTISASPNAATVNSQTILTVFRTTPTSPSTSGCDHGVPRQRRRTAGSTGCGRWHYQQTQLRR